MREAAARETMSGAATVDMDMHGGGGLRRGEVAPGAKAEQGMVERRAEMELAARHKAEAEASASRTREREMVVTKIHQVLMFVSLTACLCSLGSRAKLHPLQLVWYCHPVCDELPCLCVVGVAEGVAFVWDVI